MNNKSIFYFYSYYKNNSDFSYIFSLEERLKNYYILDKSMFFFLFLDNMLTDEKIEIFLKNNVVKSELSNASYYFVLDMSSEEIEKKENDIERFIKFAENFPIKIIFYINGINFVKKYKNCLLYIDKKLLTDNSIDFFSLIEDNKFIFSKEINNQIVSNQVINKTLIDVEIFPLPFWFYLLEKIIKFDMDENYINKILNLLLLNFDSLVDKNEFSVESINVFKIENSIIDIFKKIKVYSKGEEVIFLLITEFPFLAKYLSFDDVKKVYSVNKKIIKKDKNLMSYIVGNFLVDTKDNDLFWKKFLEFYIGSLQKRNSRINFNESLVVIPENITRKISSKYIIKYFNIFCNSVFDNELCNKTYIFNDKYKVNFLLDANVVNRVIISLVISNTKKSNFYLDSLKCYNHFFNNRDIYKKMKKFYVDYNFAENSVFSFSDLTEKEKENFIYFLIKNKDFFSSNITIYDLFVAIDKNEDMIRKIKWNI